MSRQSIQDLADGDQFTEVFLAQDKQLRANRNGNYYVQLEIRDRTGMLMARVWNAGEPLFRSFENGDYVRVSGKVQKFQGALQAILTTLEKVPTESVDPAEFLPRTSRPADQLLARLGQFLHSLKHPALRALGEALWTDEALMRAFCTAPAGVRLHHATIGGLLEHTVTMMEAAERLLPLYPGVDRDLVLLGLVLHDLGKTRELVYQTHFAYSDVGQLLGHIQLGLEILSERQRVAEEWLGEPIPGELLVRLKHLVLSHHGELAHGSPKIPMTAEAMFVHLLDWFDTRMQMVLTEYQNASGGEPGWTGWNQTLSRRFYRGGGSRAERREDLPPSDDPARFT
jgi:3'-5' exoribonuclease